jgi:hypothetical protein
MAGKASSLIGTGDLEMWRDGHGDKTALMVSENRRTGGKRIQNVTMCTKRCLRLTMVESCGDTDKRATTDTRSTLKLKVIRG